MIALNITRKPPTGQQDECNGTNDTAIGLRGGNLTRVPLNECWKSG